MKYYLIDEAKARIYLQNKIVSGTAKLQDIYRSIDVKIDDIIYGVSLDTLTIVHVDILREKVYIPTSEGSILWKNPSKIEDSNDNHEFLTPIFLFSTDTKLVCSNYICLESLPKNPVKISKNNIVVRKVTKKRYSIINNSKDLDELKIKIEETNDSLIIEYDTEVLKKKGNFDVALVEKTSERLSRYFSFIPLVNYKFDMIPPLKITLTKGTCFRISTSNESHFYACFD